MAFVARRRPPVLDTAIAAYKQTHFVPENPSLDSSSHPSVAGPSRSHSPAGSAANDENETAARYSGEDEQPSTMGEDYVLAMHDFVPAATNVQCLSFRAGQVIRVHNRDPTGWWDGELEGRRGWFPSNYVSNHVSGSAQTTFSRSKKVRSPFYPCL